MQKTPHFRQLLALITIIIGGIQLQAQQITVTTLAGSDISRSADGTGTFAYFNDPFGVAISGDFLYVADARNNRIRKINTKTGVVTTLAGSTRGYADGKGTQARFNFPIGLAISGNNLYVSDQRNQCIRKIDVNTGNVTTFAGKRSSRGFVDSIGNSARFNDPEGLVISGNTMYVADSRNNAIRMIDLTTKRVSKFAGSGRRGRVNGIGNAATFYYPKGIAVLGNNLYVADRSNHRIRKIEIDTKKVTTFAGNNRGSEDGTGTFARFNVPYGITVSGNALYIADQGNHRIRKVEIDTKKVTTIAGSERGYADATGSEAKFRSPRGVVASGDNLYIADENNHRIRQVKISTKAVTTLAGGDYRFADGPGDKAKFNKPNKVAISGDFLYVADTDNNRIRQIKISTKEVTTIAGQSISGFADGTGDKARFDEPSGIAVSGDFLYVADRDNNRIRQIKISTKEVTTFAGNKDDGFADGIGDKAKFDEPSGIAVSGDFLYVADSYNNSIRQIKISTKEVTTLAGQEDGGFVDGIGDKAQFEQPRGIAVSGDFLYVADQNNHRIRQIKISTKEVTTIAGQEDDGFADGIGDKAQFEQPQGIAVSGDYLYIGDTENHRIRKIKISTKKVTTIAGQDDNGFEDGLGDESMFDEPNGLAVLGSAIYVADRNNFRIRKVLDCTTITAPTASDQSFCSGKTVSDLVATGKKDETFVWYSTATDGDALDGKTKLTSGEYFAEAKNKDGCVSATRTKITVTVKPAATEPTASDQSFCSGKAVSDLVATGKKDETFVWYSTATDGDALDGKTILTSGEYFAEAKNKDGCVSATRTKITVTVKPATHKDCAPVTSISNSLSDDSALVIYPNPAQDRLAIATDL